MDGGGGEKGEGGGGEKKGKEEGRKEKRRKGEEGREWVERGATQTERLSGVIFSGINLRNLYSGISVL